ncbi:MAG: hypothetical protein HIU86_02050 [Acidobacteria bacterium]|nr:hypothetical protein [Acidobacteriota bacterium]
MELGDPESLRRRLYRPGASAADLAGYLRATEREADPDPVPSAIAPSGPSLRKLVIGGFVVAAAALLGTVLLGGGPPTPTATTATSAPPTIGARATGGPGRIAAGQSIVFDGGERAHANGSSVAEGPEAVRYTLASDDSVAAIASRFQLCPGDVLRALPYGFDPARLPPGETLRLSRDPATSC